MFEIIFGEFSYQQFFKFSFEYCNTLIKEFMRSFLVKKMTKLIKCEYDEYLR